MAPALDSIANNLLKLIDAFKDFQSQYASPAHSASTNHESSRHFENETTGNSSNGSVDLSLPLDPTTAPPNLTHGPNEKETKAPADLIGIPPLPPPLSFGDNEGVVRRDFAGGRSPPNAYDGGLPAASRKDDGDDPNSSREPTQGLAPSSSITREDLDKMWKYFELMKAHYDEDAQNVSFLQSRLEEQQSLLKDQERAYRDKKRYVSAVGPSDGLKAQAFADMIKASGSNTVTTTAEKLAGFGSKKIPWGDMDPTDMLSRQRYPDLMTEDENAALHSGSNAFKRRPTQYEGKPKAAYYTTVDSDDEDAMKPGSPIISDPSVELPDRTEMLRRLEALQDADQSGSGVAPPPPTNPWFPGSAAFGTTPGSQVKIAHSSSVEPTEVTVDRDSLVRPPRSMNGNKEWSELRGDVPSPGAEHLVKRAPRGTSHAGPISKK